MADIITATVDTQTGDFVPSGHDVDARYVRVVVPRNPDPLREKWDGAAIAAKTAQEIADAATAALTSTATLTSRQKDILTTCALVVRSRNVAAWNAMTGPQKKTAALAEADAWRDIRVLVEAFL